MSAGIEQMIAEGRTGRQLEMVREHWASIRRLFLTDSDLDPGANLRSELPLNFEIGCGMPGIDSVTAFGDRFEFVEAGVTAIIIPAYDGLPAMLGANAAAHVEHLIDLVAVDVDRPDQFWRRRGDAVVLGNAYLEIASQEGEPVPVFRNPLTWLRSGGAGIAVLDWNYARDLLLDRELIAEDVELGTRLAATLKPDIWVVRAAA